jgi:hypothetical protein
MSRQDIKDIFNYQNDKIKGYVEDVTNNVLRIFSMSTEEYNTLLEAENLPDGIYKTGAEVADLETYNGPNGDTDKGSYRPRIYFETNDSFIGVGNDSGNGYWKKLDKATGNYNDQWYPNNGAKGDFNNPVDYRRVNDCPNAIYYMDNDNNLIKVDKATDVFSIIQSGAGFSSSYNYAYGSKMKHSSSGYSDDYIDRSNLEGLNNGDYAWFIGYVSSSSNVIICIDLTDDSVTYTAGDLKLVENSNGITHNVHALKDKIVFAMLGTTSLRIVYQSSLNVSTSYNTTNPPSGGFGGVPYVSSGIINDYLIIATKAQGPAGQSVGFAFVRWDLSTTTPTNQWIYADDHLGYFLNDISNIYIIDEDHQIVFEAAYDQNPSGSHYNNQFYVYKSNFTTGVTATKDVSMTNLNKGDIDMNSPSPYLYNIPITKVGDKLFANWICYCYYPGTGYSYNFNGILKYDLLYDTTDAKTGFWNANSISNYNVPIWYKSDGTVISYEQDSVGATILQISIIYPNGTKKSSINFYSYWNTNSPYLNFVWSSYRDYVMFYSFNANYYVPLLFNIKSFNIIAVDQYNGIPYVNMVIDDEYYLVEGYTSTNSGIQLKKLVMSEEPLRTLVVDNIENRLN